MCVFCSELYSSEDAETKLPTGPAMHFAGWEEHLAKLGSHHLHVLSRVVFCLIPAKGREGCHAGCV